MGDRYAIKRDGSWTEISGDFQSGEGEDVVNHPRAWLDAATPAERAAIGVAAIVEDSGPDADVRIIGRELIDRDGAPAWSWLVEPRSAEDLAAVQRQAIDARAAAAFAAGFAPDHPDFADERLQVRNSEDRTNWLTSQASYAAAVAAGAGDVIDASFRTASNQTITVSYAAGLQILLGMAAWGRAIMERSWELKDALARGEAVDIDLGWPA